MNIQHKTKKQASIREHRIRNAFNASVCRTMINIWHRKDYLIENEKERLESIVDEKEAENESISS